MVRRGVRASRAPAAVPALQIVPALHRDVQSRRARRARGLFQRALPPPGPDGAPSRAARIASIGGGPGYELLALREFLRELAPPLRVELTSVDLQPGWEPFARALDCGAITADLNDGDMLSRCGAPLDIVVISYVLIYCSNEATAAMFARLLRAEGGPRAILVSERTHRQEMAGLMERQGVTVTRLMPQRRGRDERQMVWTLSPLPSRAPRDERALTFPNVPYQRRLGPTSPPRAPRAGPAYR